MRTHFHKLDDKVLEFIRGGDKVEFIDPCDGLIVGTFNNQDKMQVQRVLVLRFKDLGFNVVGNKGHPDGKFVGPNS